MHTTITLVRHGVTDWNYEGRAQGLADLPLNPEGVRQAEAVAERLSREPWDALYSSPLGRAMATAEAIGRRTGLAVRPVAAMAERDISPIEGTTVRERQARWPDGGWRSLPGMESHEACGQRAYSALEAVARRHPGERVICVSHGGWMYDLLDEIGATLHADRVLRNTCVITLSWDGLRMLREGPPDFAHLLVDGIEYSGERGRLAHALGELGQPELPPAMADGASAVESAWSDGRLVGFVRAFTDGVLYGYVDVVGARPGLGGVVPVCMARMEARYPGVRFTRLGVADVELPVPAVHPANG